VNAAKTYVSQDGEILVSISAIISDRAIQLVDAKTGNELGRIPLDSNSPQQPSMWLSPNNKMLALVSFDILGAAKGGKKATFGEPKLELYDVATGKRIHALNVAPGEQKLQKAAFLRSLALIFSSDSKVLGLSLDDQSMTFWDTVTGHRMGAMALPNGTQLNDAAFSPDGRCLALDMNDGTVTSFELASGGPRRVFGKPLPSAKNNDNGAMLFLGGVLSLTPALKQTASPVAISPDGKCLALGAPDRTAYVWDISTSSELAAFKGHRGAVNAVAFSPDSSRLASASADTTALVWDLGKVARPAAAMKALTPADLESYWQALAGSDGIKAFEAICDLTVSPKEAVAWIKDKVQPAAPVAAKQIEELIGQVNDAQFKVREKAIAELYKIGEPIIPLLDKALEATPTLETRRRLEEMRGKLTGMLLQGDRLRAYRAVEVLERIGTPDALQVLRTLADGAPGTLVTTSARTALERRRP
jgi:WD40 repeat protein